ncbi:MAG: hypothetical protein RLZZ555_1730 [Pseudomonadota bacterium]
MLYYPGAGMDYGPLQYFALNHDLAVAVYVDYLVKPEWIRSMLRSVSSIEPELHRIAPKDLGCHRWADFWPEDENSRMFAKPTRAFGLQCDLQIHPGRSTRLIYLATEGHQTYRNLLGTALQPDLVVLQDHGFGGNWRDFGGESPMYRMAQAAGALPPLLFSAGENTRVWPGYRAIDEPILLAGQAHHYRRTLYQLRDANPESEYDGWHPRQIWD